MGKIDDILAGKQDQQMSDISGEDAMKHLVGEGAKYATVEDMAKAMLNGQLHITQLEKENGTYRDASQQTKGIDDILAALKTGKQHDDDDGNHHDADQHHQGGSDELTVAEQITAAFATRDAKTVGETEDANLIKVTDELSKLYGTNALTVFKKVGNDLNLDLESLAKKSPAAVMKLVADARPAEHNNLGLQQSTVTSTLAETHGGVMNQTAIAKLYKEGKLNRDQKISLENEMLTQLGSEFFK